MKLGLGTVQFGMDYGATNSAGKVPFSEVVSILKMATDNGVDLLDTAIAYGDSEAVLGKAFLELGGCPFRMVSKLPKLTAPVISSKVICDLEKQLDGSLERLSLTRLSGLLLHDADDLLKPGADQCFQFLDTLRQRGLVDKIGVSVYYPAQVEKILSRYDIDLVQLPMNVLDQRFVQAGSLSLLKKHDVEIHVRSVLLQGILMATPQALPQYVSRLVSKLQKLDALSDVFDVDRLVLLFAFLQQLQQVDHAVLGVTTTAEFTELANALSQVSSLPTDQISWIDLQECDEALILPNRWKVT